MFWTINGQNIPIPTGESAGPAGPIPLEVPDPADHIDDPTQPGQVIDTWTPQLGWFRGASPDTTYAVQSGQICKTGNYWTFWAYFTLSHVGTFGGPVVVTGYTFPPEFISGNKLAIFQGGSMSIAYGLSPSIPAGTKVTIRQPGGFYLADIWLTDVNGGERQMVATDLTDNARLVCNWSYELEDPYVPEPPILDSSSYYGLVTNDHPWLWWKMNEEILRPAHDSSGNGYDGTATGIPFVDLSVTPDLLTCARLDGSQAFTNTSAVIPTPGSESFEVWFNSDFPDLEQFICAQGTNPATAGYRALTLHGSVLTFTAINDSTETVTIATVSNAIVGGLWYHAVAVVDNSAHQITLYLNGVLVGSTPSPSSHTFLTTQAQFTAGRRADSGTDKRFVGKLDEIIRYMQALPPEVAILRYQTVIH